jgi:hypothetical protein
MNTTTTVLRWWVRGAGVVQLALGLVIWTGNADSLTGIHMLLGITLVLALWALAVLGAVARVNPAQVALAFVWGAITPVLGVAQEGLLPGSAHWVIQVVHLLVGLGVIGQGEGLARRIKQRLAMSHRTHGMPTPEGVAQ